MLGGIALVLLFTTKLDATGRTIALVMAGVGLPIAAYKIHRALKLPAAVPLATVDTLPEGERATALRRLRAIFVGAMAILAAWTAYDLRTLDKGEVDSVSTFGPAAAVYNLLGFWPAVSLLPALGIVGAWGITRRLREAEKR